MPEDLKIDRRTLLKTAVSAGAAPAVLAADANAVRWSEVHDVVIAGAGGAGLAAAVMAGGISKDVVVLEKTQDVGGNTRLADAFNAVDPAVQKPLGIEDSPELHARQMLETGRWCADPKLVETVATGAPRALAWLKELGVRFEPDVYQVYGSLWPRTHSPSEPEGSGYIHPLLFKCRELGVSIRTGTKVLRVIRNGLEGPVLGVEAERRNGRRLFIRARRGVVVATGGFGANAVTRRALRPEARAPSLDEPARHHGRPDRAARGHRRGRRRHGLLPASPRQRGGRPLHRRRLHRRAHDLRQPRGRTLHR